MIGGPGSSPRSLVRRRSAARLVLTITAAGVALGAAVTDRPLTAVAAAGGVALIQRAYRPRIARARAGASAEVEVAAALRRLPAELVAHGVHLPGRRSDLDVVVLGPMSAVVEVKRASGRTRVRSDGTVRVAGRDLPGNPGRQSVAGAAALSRFLGVGPVDAVLCVTGMRQRPRRVRLGTTRRTGGPAAPGGAEITVCSVRHLRRVLRRLEHRLTSEQVETAVVRLR